LRWDARVSFSLALVALFVLAAAAPAIAAPESQEAVATGTPATSQVPGAGASRIDATGSAPPLAFSSRADNWWRFKHDNSNAGTTTGPAPNYAYLLWETNLGANPFVSSPAIVDGVAYIGSSRTTGNGYVHAFNVSTGLQQWRYSFTGDNGTLSSPAVTADKVIVGFGDGRGNGGTVALNRANGQEAWRRPSPINCASSAAVNGNNVYIGCRDGKLYALNLANGNLVWEANPQSGIDSSPSVAYGRVYVTNCPSPQPNCQSRVFAYYESNGTKAWEFSANGGHISSGGAVSNGRVIFGTARSMEVISLNATQGTLAWRRNITGPIDMTPSVHGGKVFVGTNNGTASRMWALNESNGATVWSYPVLGNLFSSPAVASGKVIFGTSEPSMLALTESGGTHAWAYTTVSAPVFSSPAVYDSKVAFGDNSNRFYVLGLDTTPPSILSTYPADNAVNFPVGDNFTVTFSEEMDPASAAGQYNLAPSGGNLTHSWDVDSKILSIMHPQPLVAETNYTLTIAAGVLRDSHMNALTAGKTVKFRTRDVTPPRLLSFSPAGNITDAPVNQQIKLVFNEPMSANATCLGVAVVASAGGNTNKLCSWTPDRMTLTIDPDTQWTGNNRYDIQVTKGAVDLAGNGIANPTQFHFTTKDTAPPQVQFVEPQDNAVNVAPDAVIKVRFNELVDTTTLETGFTISPLVSGNFQHNGSESVFTPAPPGLAGDTDYTVQLLGVKDVVGNAMPAPYTWKFRTRDTSPPAFQRSEPPTGATDVPKNVIVKLFFSEKMDEASLDAAITMTDGASPVSTDAHWNDSAGHATVTPSRILDEGETYFLNVSAAAKDVAGNPMGVPVKIFFTVHKTPPPPDNKTQDDSLLGKIFQYWPIILIAIIVIIIIAAVIPSRGYLHDYYGVSEEDLKKSEIGAKKEQKQVNCEVCSLSLERDDYTKCKSCGHASHVACLKKLKKCPHCKEPV
jgi:outer membrane protein assembly factor BamB